MTTSDDPVHAMAAVLQDVRFLIWCMSPERRYRPGPETAILRDIHRRYRDLTGEDPETFIHEDRLPLFKGADREVHPDPNAADGPVFDVGL